jgi:glycosyltransferase involved in cell wall biosynthesis
VIFLADSSEPFPWLEALLGVLNRSSSSNASYRYFTIAPDSGYTQLLVKKELIVGDQKKIRSTLPGRLWNLYTTVRSDSTILIPTSYKTSVVAYLLNKFKKVRVVSLLMNQPNYFKFFPKSKFKRFIHENLRRVCVRKFDLLICFSKEVVDKHIQDGIVSTRLKRIPIGVNLQPLFTSAANRPAFRHWKKTNFLVISRLSPEKDLFRILKILQDLRRLGWAGKLRIIGEGPLRHDIQSMVSKSDLSAWITLVGQIEGVVEEIGNCDVLMHAALTESYGQVLAEGRAGGAMLVTTEVGVGIDLKEFGDSLTHFLGKEGNQIDAIKIRDFLISNQGKKGEGLDVLKTHDRELCFEQISQCIKNLVRICNNDIGNL